MIKGYNQNDMRGCHYKMAVTYKLMSFFYDLVDVIYFKKEESSPRKVLVDMLPDKPLYIADICAGTGSNSLIIAKYHPDSKITAIERYAECCGQEI